MLNCSNMHVELLLEILILITIITIFWYHKIKNMGDYKASQKPQIICALLSIVILIFMLFRFKHIW